MSGASDRAILEIIQAQQQLGTLVGMVNMQVQQLALAEVVEDMTGYVQGNLNAAGRMVADQFIPGIGQLLEIADQISAAQVELAAKATDAVDAAQRMVQELEAVKLALS